MNSKQVFSYVVPVVAMCILGLLVAQVVWFKDALQLKEDQFKDKVFVVLNQAGDALSKKETLEAQLAAYVSTGPTCTSQVNVETGTLQEEFGLFLDSIMTANKMPRPYKYGVMEGNCDGPIVKLSNLTGEELEKIDYLEFQTGEPLSCYIGGCANQHFLGLQFPNKNAYLLRQAGGMLGLSVLLILLMLGAFWTMLWVIRRQKKLADIKNDFINNLTHEFKTPIASIALASSVLQKGQEQPFNQEDLTYLQLIKDESKRLENQVDKLLQMAMVDSGNFALDNHAVDLHELLHKVGQSCSVLLHERNGHIHLDLQASRATIQGDAAHLFNLFYNLLDNAIKYSPEAPEIVFQTKDVEEGFCFIIRDKGIGMPEEVQRNIFEKFYRAESGVRHNVKGFGLGLSYVRSIVDAHRGKITFKSSENSGTEFRILLPTG